MLNVANKPIKLNFIVLYVVMLIVMAPRTIKLECFVQESHFY
jgi:hypothetical protein